MLSPSYKLKLLSILKIVTVLLLIIYSITASAQAPGNISTNLSIWLKADDLAEGDFGTWTDASGNGNSPTQATA